MKRPRPSQKETSNKKSKSTPSAATASRYAGVVYDASLETRNAGSHSVTEAIKVGVNQ